jgi:integrase
VVGGRSVARPPHAFATELLTAEVRPKVVSEALGHSSVAFMIHVYQHVLPAMGDQVAAALESVFTREESAS